MAQIQSKTASGLDHVDPVWARIRYEADEIVRREPDLASFINSAILRHDTLEAAVIERVSERLHRPEMSAELIRQSLCRSPAGDPAIAHAFRADIVATFDRDPATDRFIEPVLYFKGFHAMQTHRLAHWLWGEGRRDFALYLQSISSSVFQTDIHPAAPIGRGIFLDHATGLVVGETAVIEDDVSILHDVTLGGTGNEDGDRHPKIRRGVMLGAGAKIIGNIEIGHCARVAAGLGRAQAGAAQHDGCRAFRPRSSARPAAPSRHAPWTRCFTLWIFERTGARGERHGSQEARRLSQAFV